MEHEKEILKAQALNEPKPKPINIIEKMIEGRIHKFYKEICLVEQPFVKDADKTVAQLLKENGNVSVVRFTRYAMGEGLEKKQEDLAAEDVRISAEQAALDVQAQQIQAQIFRLMEDQNASNRS